MLVIHRGDKPTGLVEHDVDMPVLVADLPALDGHDIPVRIDFLADFRDLPVDPDFPLPDHLFTLAAGGDPALCHILLQSQFLCHVEPLFSKITKSISTCAA